jgi:hypothetical protein
MNYDEHMASLIAFLGLDKGIPQPYRNGVVSSARRLQMEIRGALTFTNLKPPDGIADAMNCICPPGAISKTCRAAVHHV